MEEKRTGNHNLTHQMAHRPFGGGCVRFHPHYFERNKMTYDGRDMIGDNGYGTWDAERLDKEYQKLKTENKRLEDWINDLQAGMYINCVYCGHRYGPDTEVPPTMTDVLKKHIEQCPKHPLAILRKAVEEAGYVFDNKDIPDYIFERAKFLGHQK